MKNIVLTRIDDRLIHGQVMTAWLGHVKGNMIMVIDDVVEKDQFLKMVLKSSVPANIKLGIFSVETAINRIKEGFDLKDRVIILVKYPETLYKMNKAGIEFETINIGGMAMNADRKKLFRNIAASEAEKDMLKEMQNNGVEITVQIVPTNTPTKIDKYL